MTKILCLTALLVLGCSKPTPIKVVTGHRDQLEPWSIICDEQSGKFTFMDDRIVWIDEFDTFDEAVATMRRLKRQSEQDESSVSPEEEARIKAIWSKDWKACPTPKP